MLNIKNLTIKDLKNHILIDDFSFTLGDRDKVAFIGEEGNGKSTLIKAIYDRNLIEDYTSISGSIETDITHIGYFEQQLASVWDETEVIEYLLKDDVKEEIPWEKYNELAKIEKICVQLGIPITLLGSKQTIQTLSGGEKVKLQLLKLLHKQCDLLLLDEPTNDLDLHTLDWLEHFLCELKIPVIFISHDEMLLQTCANRIMHLEQLNKKSKCRLQDYRGSYNEYIASRKNQLQKQV